MRKLLPHKLFSPYAIQILVFIVSSGVLILALSLSNSAILTTTRYLLWLVVLLFSAALAWLTGQQFMLHRKQEDLQRHFGEIQQGVPELQRRLDSILLLNHRLLDVQDEKGLMDTALEVIANLVGASAVTFVPFDELGQPLSAFTYGDMPEPMLRAWAEHLVSPTVVDRCANCKVLHALPNSNCPMLEGQFSRAVSLFCLPLRRGERTLGMLNMHIPAGKSIAPDMMVFLEGLLHEIALAIQTIRLRNQEMNTLRQLQMMRTTRVDLSALLESLIEGLQQVLAVDYAYMQVRAIEPWQDGAQVQDGQLAGLEPRQIQELCEQAMTTGKLVSAPSPLGTGMMLAAPLHLSQGRPVGAVLIGSAREQLGAREEHLLRHLAEQAGLTIDNERGFLLLEYNAVIQERVRLAREIHDGLAQTLAFLKLKTAQMQGYLNQGDMQRLVQGLQQHYQVLNDAYLDTRHAIDNLRKSTHQGLITWIEQTAVDFEAASGMTIERQLNPPVKELSPEVQAQLIRIVQEALSNVRKHADASRVWIALHQWNSDLILEIGDDGTGFSPEDVPELTRYGLRGMRERAEFIGADFQIISQLRQGTLVRLRLPLFEETVL